ncbi:hypothetical protein H0H93_003989, partial [Arthromyces matolae]
MFTPFNEERKRKINLGGTSSAVSHSTLLGNVRALRTERLEQQKRHDSAARVQAWWRGTIEARRVRRDMRKAFENDLCGITGLRCLVIAGRQDDEFLSVWSKEMVNGDSLFSLPRNPQYQKSWLVLIKQAAALLLSSVARNPNQSSSVAHLKVLNALLSRSATTTALGSVGAYVSVEITNYLLKRNFYSLASQSFMSIPLNSRSSPSLPLLVALTIQPFSTFEIHSNEYITSLNALFSSILSIPLLPNRIPPAALVDLSAHIPFSQLGSLDVNSIIETTHPDDQLNLLANLQVFVPPRYKALNSESRRNYFTLVSSLLNALPTKILNPVPPKPNATTTTTTTTVPSALQSDSDEGSDDEDRRTKVTVVTTFSPPKPPRQPLTPPDTRTLKRLSTLPSTTHLTSLLSLPSSPPTRPALIALLFALCAVWPADVPQRILALSPSLVREIYRGYVRGGSIGWDTSLSKIMEDGGEAEGEQEQWPPFLLLVELYTKAMMTMGDDEFFGSTNSAGAGGRVLGSGSSFSGSIAGAAEAGVTIPRNPLSLDELVEWSAKLKNLA